uniref:Putative histone-lysine n-methyltransferase setd1b n=1 Tax=Tabanus bromius TaxID=304241 RepID=A0A0K8TKG3_TABBR
MFNPNQMPDNPGYMDFNEPTPARLPSPVKHTKPPVASKTRISRRVMQPTNMKFSAQRNQNNTNGWMPPRLIPGQVQNQHPPIMPVPPVGRNFRNNIMGRNRHMPPPIGIRPPIPPPPPPPNMNTRFGPRPLLPLPPVSGCALGPPPPPPGSSRPVRGVGGGPIPSVPNLLPPRVINLPNVPGPIRHVKNISNNRRSIRNRKRAPANSVASSTKGKKSSSSKKTLSEIVNQYPIDKPWVNNEIRAEHKKKEEIENKLKGKKDDRLFAEFKIQRDKFVTMYEAARLEYVEKQNEQVKTNLEKTPAS